MRKLKRVFRRLKDRRASNARHDLAEIVIIALAATLAGARSCIEFEFFGKGREELLRRFLDLKHGIPSHDTFSNVFRVLDPRGLEAVLHKFSKSFGIKGVVSIDGKALRGAFARGRKATLLHMVNVWADSTRMALAQRKAPNRNEVAGALQVLALLDLDGALVTADALHCRPDTARAIRQRKGHYVLAIKSNRGRLFQAVKALLERPRKPSRATQRTTMAHGRTERRQAVVVAAPKLGAAYDFPDLAAVGRIDSWRARIGKVAKHKVRYFLLSRPLSANKMLKVVRAHWGVENNLHWVLDVLFAETPVVPAPITRPRTSPPSARSPSTSSRQPLAPFASVTKCSKPDGTTTSFSTHSPICDSPTPGGTTPRGGFGCVTMSRCEKNLEIWCGNVWDLGRPTSALRSLGCVPVNRRFGLRPRQCPLCLRIRTSA
jgi:predicted transposase YbfD/YdcC